MIERIKSSNTVVSSDDIQEVSFRRVDAANWRMTVCYVVKDGNNIRTECTEGQVVLGSDVFKAAATTAAIAAIKSTEGAK